MKTLRPALLVTAITFLVATAAPADPTTPSAPVPAEAEIEEAGKLVREVHKADYGAKKTADLITLARKLLKEGDETANNPAAKYVLYREARDLAARGGDVPLALEAVDATAKAFAVNPAELTSATLEAAERARAAPGRAVAEAALDAADEAIRTDDYPTADRLLKVATAAATRAASVPGLTAVVAARVKDLEAIRKGFEATAADRKAVLANAADPAAAGRVGRFLCLLKGDWETGLPLLAKGEDEKLKVAAEQELGKPEKGADKAALGDRWWDLSDGLEAAERAGARVRSYRWYQEAAGELTGLAKTRVEKRLAEIEKAEPRVTRGRGAWTVVFRSADPAIWNTATNRGKDGYAVPLDKVPAGVKYLRLTDTAKRNYVVIEMTTDRLGKRTEKDGYGWNGTSEFQFNAHQLGIYNLAWDDLQRGRICIHTPGGFHGYHGWGFGCRAYIDDVQGYTWAREPVEKMVFEIAVKTTPLTAEEAKHLLKKK